MAPLPAAGKYLRVRLLWSTGNPNPIGSKFYLQYTGTDPAPAALSAIGAQVATAYSTTLYACASTGLELTEVEVAGLSTSPSTLGTHPAAISGAKTGSIPTEATAAILEKQIARAYRGGKPKMFLPFGVAADLANSNTWDSALQTQVQGDWAAFIALLTGFSTSGTTIGAEVSISYYDGLTQKIKGSTGRYYYVGTPRSTPLVDPVIGNAMRLVIGAQRRRRGSS